MTTQSPKTPPPLPDAGDSRLDSFLLKAAPIIAAERGINAKSRIMLEALARDSKLPDELFDQAIHMLQGAPPVASKKRNRWYRAYVKYLEQQLKEVPRGIITASVETRAIQKGTSKFQLSHDHALEALREVAAELGIRRISQSEAERHVASIVQQKVGDVEWLDDATMTLLHDSGRKWGLSTEQVDSIVQRFLDENRRRREREHKTAVVAISSACALIMIILAAIVGLMLFGNKGERPVTQSDAVQNDQPDVDTAPVESPVKSFDPPSWWSESLTMASVKVRINEATFGEIYQQLVSGSPSTRAKAYRQLTELCRDQLKTSRDMSRLMVDQIFVESYALEPSDDAADEVRSSLLKLITEETGKLPSDADAYDRGFWAVRVALDALRREELSDQRASKLELELGEAIGTAVRRNGDRRELEERCLSSLAEQYYAQLVGNAVSEPHLTSDLHLKLSRMVAQLARGDPDLLNRLDSMYLGALLTAEEDVWTRYDEIGLIDICISSADPVNVLKFVEALEKTDNRELQLSLAKKFIILLGAIPKSADPADVAHAVREKMGLTARSTAKTARDRWKILEENIERFQRERDSSLSAASRSPSTRAAYQRRERLTGAVDLAHLATLACALAQQEAGIPEFDQLNEEGPPKLSSEEKRGPRNWFRPRNVIGGLPVEQRKRDELQEQVDKLAEGDQLIPVIRQSVFKRLARLADQIPHIAPDQGRVIASFMLSAMGSSDQPLVVDKAEDLARWKHVRLALADLIRETGVACPTVEPLLSAVLDRKVKLEPQRWQLDANSLLLRSVLDDLSAETAIARSRSPDTIYDAGAAALQSRYKVRARLLGIPSTAYDVAESPADLLQVLVDFTAEKVRGKATTKSDKSFLDSLPHRLRAVGYLGTNDVKTTVLLQRIWVHLVAIQLKSQRSDRSSKATQLVDGLNQRDAKATDLLAQLEDGESTTLAMWKLFGP